MSVSRGVDYPALRQTPYVALVVPGLSGVETGPIRGVGCTGVWGEIVIVWYGRTWRRLSSMLIGPMRGVGSTGVWGDYVVILGNVQFIGETLPKFRQKVSVFIKWARHRGDVGKSTGSASFFWEIRGGSFQEV
ncbi:hypothetical protein Prudu_001470 [Prunus dulcis]|uniref:Uncharacterized protein n=1 Tax=Prunus dulcis TaxID=3755 RepID=A0A4Y1QNP0_PRUDU|nr:hypothetical protein Prudu_001470 [Prunus dulcis]